MSENLRVISFELDEGDGAYQTATPGDQSGDYVPLAQAEALRAAACVVAWRRAAEWVRYRSLR